MMAFLLVCSALAGGGELLVLPDESDSFGLGDADALPSQPWWQTLDPQVARLVDEALGSNQDVLALWAMVQQVEAGADLYRAALFPMASFDVASSTSPTSSRGFGYGLSLPDDPSAPDTYTSGSAKFSLSFAPDISTVAWRSWRASRHDAAAAGGDRDAATLAVAAVVAEAWYDVLLSRRQLDVLQAQLQNNRDVLELVQLRYEGGGATSLDVLQQRQQVAALAAAVPQARAGLRMGQQRLAVLLGRAPTATADLAGGGELPQPGALAVGTPRELIEHRPDLRAAQDRYEAAQLRRQAAFLQLVPSLGVAASTGWQGMYETEWETQDTWNVAASLSMPLFVGGATLAGVRSAKAGEAYAAHDFSQAVLTAWAEVESALVLEQEYTEQLDATRTQLQAARQAWDATRAWYVDGNTTYVSVLNALTALQQAELAELKAQRALLSARIQIYDALGGSWTTDLGGGDQR